MIAGVIITTVLLLTLSIVTLGTAVLLVIKFGHPDDRNQALWPKTVVVAALFLSAAAVFVFPLDVASLADARLRPFMSTVWYAIFAGVALAQLLVVPVSVSIYEDADGPNSRRKCCSVLFGLLPTLLIGVLTACLFPFFGEYTMLAPADTEKLNGMVQQGSAARLIVDFLLFGVAVIAMLGWLAFVVFVPIGLVVLPMDLVNAFTTRPKPMMLSDYSREKLQIGRKATHLLSIANDEKAAREQAAFRRSKLSRADRKAQIALEIETYELKKRQAYLDEAFALRGGNPLWYLLQLVMGVVFLMVTASWIVHVAVFVVFGVAPGLNAALEYLQAFPVGAVLFFTLHALYLLAAGVKGAFRFSLGTRQLSIYPMEVGNTLMNAFLINVWLILSLVFPLVQFCAVAFHDFVHGTAIAAIVLRLNYLPLFRDFVFYHNIHVLVMAAIMFVTLLVTLACPRNSTKEMSIRLRSSIELR